MRSGDTNTHLTAGWVGHPLIWRTALLLLAAVLAGLVLTSRSTAQDMPPQRQLRTFIPPDQIVSFLPTTPFDQFLDSINPIFIQVTGKRVIDPESRTQQIGVSIVGMQFFDAFELVLEMHGLRYRETDRYFIIERAPDPTLDRSSDDALAERESAVPGDVVVTARSREIEIEAVLFNFNHTNSRELGLDWSVFWGQQQGQQGGQQQGGTQQAEFFLKTDELFEPLDDWLISPDQISFRQLNQFFRLTEQTGVGHTIASPKVTVRSGEQGRIQIGSDIPVQTRDFAGNTLTQFVSTGVIINVTPTLITSPVADTLGAPLLEFIHLDVRVERSTGRPFAGSVAIDRAGADTEILLLDGEMTIIGGLYGKDETVERNGIPILKDLPWWVFGLRYIFGNESVVETDNELLIVLRAGLLDPLPVRAERPYPREHRNSSRKQVIDLLRRFDQREVDEKWPEELKPYEEQSGHEGSQPGEGSEQ